MINVVAIFERVFASGAAPMLRAEKAVYLFSGVAAFGTFFACLVISFVLAWLFGELLDVGGDPLKNAFAVFLVVISASGLEIWFGLYALPRSQPQVRVIQSPLAFFLSYMIPVFRSPFRMFQAFALRAFAIANGSFGDMAMLTGLSSEVSRKPIFPRLASRNLAHFNSSCTKG